VLALDRVIGAGGGFVAEAVAGVVAAGDGAVLVVAGAVDTPSRWYAARAWCTAAAVLPCAFA